MRFLDGRRDVLYVDELFLRLARRLNAALRRWRRLRIK